MIMCSVYYFLFLRNISFYELSPFPYPLVFWVFLQTFVTYLGLTSKWHRANFCQIIGVPFYTPNSKV